MVVVLLGVGNSSSQSGGETEPVDKVIFDKRGAAVSTQYRLRSG